MNVFWKKGFEAASIDDLTEVTGLTRASLYNAFGSKKDLAVACTERFAREVISPVVAHLENDEPDPFEAIETFLRALFAARSKEDRIAGCLLLNTTIELTAEGDKDLFRAANEPMVAVEKLIATRLSQVSDSAELLASFVMTSIQGIRIMAKRGTPPKRINELITCVMGALTHLANRCCN
jgi:TetR/AcrR family transcriptional repressor of nem operon